MTADQRIEFAADFKRDSQSGAAVLLFNGSRDVWVPKSLLEEVDKGTYTVPYWFAKKKGIV